jgi:hypothetical protein
VRAHGREFSPHMSTPCSLTRSTARDLSRRERFHLTNHFPYVADSSARCVCQGLSGCSKSLSKMARNCRTLSGMGKTM